MKSKQRDSIIARLESCRDKNKEFYKRHSDLLEELNYKINALKNGADYEIKDVGWIVGYVGGKIGEADDDKMTKERAKEIYKELFLK